MQSEFRRVHISHPFPSSPSLNQHVTNQAITTSIQQSHATHHIPNQPIPTRHVFPKQTQRRIKQSNIQDYCKHSIIQTQMQMQWYYCPSASASIVCTPGRDTTHTTWQTGSGAGECKEEGTYQRGPRSGSDFRKERRAVHFLRSGCKCRGVTA